MKIGIDIRCLSEGRRTGVEEYTINLLKNLFEKDNKNEYVLFFNSFRNNGVDLSWIRKYKNARVKIFFFPNKLLNFLFWYLGWPKIDRMLGGVDIFFAPNINFLSVSRDAKLFLTFHDLSFELFPETFSWKRRAWHFFVNPRRLAKKADKIISVSNSTKRDLVNYYGIDSEKIDVIHNGIDDSLRVVDRNNFELIESKDKYNLPFNFILYFGTIEPRKNIVGIVKMYNCLRESGCGKTDKYKLVIAGETGWKSKDIFLEIEKSKFKGDIIIIQSVNDLDKLHLYNLASVFVYPSFFEGFGFPPLEAMSCGVPAVVSNNSSFPETVGSAAIMIDPDRPDEMFTAVKGVIDDIHLRNELKERGLSQVRTFKWQKTAEEFLSILKK
ncbi:glycosyltransferase family 4 protein [Patescibacteria group bacterium]